jgi:hypothetical protein
MKVVVCWLVVCLAGEDVGLPCGCEGCVGSKLIDGCDSSSLFLIPLGETLVPSNGSWRNGIAKNEAASCGAWPFFK